MGYKIVVDGHEISVLSAFLPLGEILKISKVLIYLSTKDTNREAKNLGGIGVNGHICFKMISFSRGLSSKYAVAFSKAALGCVKP